jgi:hypothetical protein
MAAGVRHTDIGLCAPRHLLWCTQSLPLAMRRHTLGGEGSGQAPSCRRDMGQAVLGPEETQLSLGMEAYVWDGKDSDGVRVRVGTTHSASRPVFTMRRRWLERLK